MRRGLVLRSTAVVSRAESSPSTVSVLKDYKQIEIARRQEAEALKKQATFKDVPLRYQLLEVLPGQSLAQTKLKYLLACRKHHPEVGGDPEMFLRVSLAYQDCMKDFGIETVDNKIVNLGNFQSCEHELKNYLEARTKITSYIPLSTLQDHIVQLEEVQTRLGIDVSRRLADNSDDAFWLLEDIEKVVEMTGVSSVTLSVLSDGSVKVSPGSSAIEGKTESPQIESGDASASPPKMDPSVSSGAPSADANSTTIARAEVSLDDITCLTAKHNVQKREDVAGLAARVATGVMNNTKEKFQVRFEAMVAACIAFNLGFLILAYLDAYMRAKSEEEARPEVKDHITTNTMLPWWGNDTEYEAQVKRIFVEEWRRARSSARRVQVFQDGVARESLPTADKVALDVGIFDVTAERLSRMREHAEAQKGRQ